MSGITPAKRFTFAALLEPCTGLALLFDPVIVMTLLAGRDPASRSYTVAGLDMAQRAAQE